MSFRLHYPPYVIPTEAKRSGGILAPSCLEPGAVDPSIPLRSSRDDTGVVRSSRDDMVEGGMTGMYDIPPALPPVCHSDRSEAEWRNPGTAMHRTRCGRSLHSAYAPVGMTGMYVIPTGAKRSGGILAPSCLEPTAKDPSIPLRSSRDDTGVARSSRDDRNACHSDRSEAKWRNPGTFLPRTNCGRSLHSACAPVGMTW